MSEETEFTRAILENYDDDPLLGFLKSAPRQPPPVQQRDDDVQVQDCLEAKDEQVKAESAPEGSSEDEAEVDSEAGAKIEAEDEPFQPVAPESQEDDAIDDAIDDPYCLSAKLDDAMDNAELDDVNDAEAGAKIEAADDLAHPVASGSQDDDAIEHRLKLPESECIAMSQRLRRQLKHRMSTIDDAERGTERPLKLPRPLPRRTFVDQWQAKQERLEDADVRCKEAQDDGGAPCEDVAKMSPLPSEGAEDAEEDLAGQEPDLAQEDDVASEGAEDAEEDLAGQDNEGDGEAAQEDDVAKMSPLPSEGAEDAEEDLAVDNADADEDQPDVEGGDAESHVVPSPPRRTRPSSAHWMQPWGARAPAAAPEPVAVPKPRMRRLPQLAKFGVPEAPRVVPPPRITPPWRTPEVVPPDYPNQYREQFDAARAWRPGHGRYDVAGQPLGGREGGRGGKNHEWVSAKKKAHENGSQGAFYKKYPKPLENAPGYPEGTHFVW